MARIFIGVGHGGKDPGAVGNGLRESDVNLVMGVTLMEELKRHGVIVGISRLKDEDDPLYEEIAEANAFKPDVAVECHNNAGGGDGFEVYRQTGAYSVNSTKLASNIEKHVIDMGQNSRGVKTRVQANGTDYFGWLRQLKCPAILCEGAFLDNKTDVQIIDTIPEQQAFGVAYAKGVLDYFGIPWRPAQSEAEASDIMYGVMKQVIALGDQNKAQAYAAAMNKNEPDAYWFIMEKK